MNLHRQKVFGTKSKTTTFSNIYFGNSALAPENAGEIAKCEVSKIKLNKTLNVKVTLSKTGTPVVVRRPDLDGAELLAVLAEEGLFKTEEISFPFNKDQILKPFVRISSNISFAAAVFERNEQ